MSIYDNIQLSTVNDIYYRNYTIFLLCCQFVRQYSTNSFQEYNQVLNKTKHFFAILSIAINQALL